MFRQHLASILTLVRNAWVQLNSYKWKLRTLGNGVSWAPSVKDLARISMENKWKCAELGAHSVQAPCSQSKAAVLFCTIQLEWGDRLRHQLSYLQWGGRALCLKKGRRSQSRAGHARPSSLHIMSLFRNIHEEIPCLYFNFFPVLLRSNWHPHRSSWGQSDDFIYTWCEMMTTLVQLTSIFLYRYN